MKFTWWWNKVFLFALLTGAIVAVIIVGTKAHLEGAVIAAIVAPLAIAMAQMLPAVEKTKEPTIAASAVQAVTQAAVKEAVAILSNPPPALPGAPLVIIPAAPRPPTKDKT